MSKHRRRAHHWSTQEGMPLEHAVGNAAGARKQGTPLEQDETLQHAGGNNNLGISQGDEYSTYN